VVFERVIALLFCPKKKLASPVCLIFFAGQCFDFVCCGWCGNKIRARMDFGKNINFRVKILRGRRGLWFCRPGKWKELSGPAIDMTKFLGVLFQGWPPPAFRSNCLRPALLGAEERRMSSFIASAKAGCCAWWPKIRRRRSSQSIQSMILTKIVCDAMLVAKLKPCKQHNYQ